MIDRTFCEPVGNSPQDIHIWSKRIVEAGCVEYNTTTMTRDYVRSDVLGRRLEESRFSLLRDPSDGVNELRF